MYNVLTKHRKCAIVPLVSVSPATSPSSVPGYRKIKVGVKKHETRLDSAGKSDKTTKIRKGDK
jgi:hypothetical protein